MCLRFIAKVFEDGRALNRELISMCGVSLVIALLEHLGMGSPEVVQHIPTINQYYLQGMTEAQGPDYKKMIVQGLMMNIWYDMNVTLESLKQLDAVDAAMGFILDNIGAMEHEFEIKRLLIGLSSLLMSPGQMDSAVHARSTDFMRAICYLCEKSLGKKVKEEDKKGEKAEVDKNAETAGAMLFNGDDNYADGLDALADGDDDSEDDVYSEDEDDDCELYDTILDGVDDVLLVQERLETLQAQCRDQWEFLLGQLSEAERNALSQVLAQNAQFAAQTKQAEEQTKAAE